MPIKQRTSLYDDTLIVVGSRGEAAIFPYGFFRWWRLEKNMGRFVVLTFDAKRD